jgi:hypothetical protein
MNNFTCVSTISQHNNGNILRKGHEEGPEEGLEVDKLTDSALLSTRHLNLAFESDSGRYANCDGGSISSAVRRWSERLQDRPELKLADRAKTLKTLLGKQT